ncbi:MAG: dTMP kinase [Pseudomonadota bacterium]
MNRKGLFITIEGGEGAGKSTAVELIQARFQQASIPLVCTREPGGTALGEQLRDLLLTPRDTDIDSLAELLMMFAARAQHLSELVRPALERGQCVLCDRFTDASYAYQGWGRGLGSDSVSVLEKLVQGGLQPDATLLLDVSPEVGLARARGRAALDRFEREDIAFFERVRAAYLHRAEKLAGRYWIVDANRELASVKIQLHKHLDELIEKYAVTFDER